MTEAIVIAGRGQVYRNRTNRLAGLVLQFMLVGVWILTDPLELRGALPADESFGPAGAVVVALSLGAAAIVSLAVWWYPAVEVSPTTVFIKNPFKTTVIPREEIREVDSSRAYVRIVTSERTYRCAGLENSLSMMIQHSDRSSTGRLASEMKAPPRPADGGVRSMWRRPSILELTVASGWVLLAIVSLIVKR